MVEIYRRSRTSGPLRQAEILSSVAQTTIEPSSVLAGRQLETFTIQHDWAVIVSQDCDLDWDYASRFPKAGAPPPRNKDLPNILLCEARSVPEGVRLDPFDQQMWRRITQKQDERYHLLDAIAPINDRLGIGSDALLIDFKRYFTVSTSELYKRLSLRQTNPERAQRRSELETPYREDLCSRFSRFQSRIALPENYA